MSDTGDAIEGAAPPSKRGETAVAGFHRVRLELAKTREWLTFYVPLDASGRLAPEGRTPWLGKGLWDTEEGLFELIVESADTVKIAWSDGGETLMQLGRAPVRKGGVIRLLSTDDPKNVYWDYVVRDVARV